MEKESIGERGMGISYKGSQGQTKRTIELQEEEEENIMKRHVLWMFSKQRN
jgi:hypothetical protein